MVALQNPLSKRLTRKIVQQKELRDGTSTCSCVAHSSAIHQCASKRGNSLQSADALWELGHPLPAHHELSYSEETHGLTDQFPECGR
jgi:hypothetical protein